MKFTMRSAQSSEKFPHLNCDILRPIQAATRRTQPVLRRLEVRKVVLLAMFLGFTLSLPAQEQPRPPAQPPAGLFTPLAGEFTPLAPADLASRPAPRLFDGTPDISGPWVGGGSNDDIEREGGLKAGEIPLLPWAKALRDSRKEEDEPYL